jgi:hypothetical protein
VISSHSLADQVVEKILELSADAQIKRRATSKYSLAFHDLTVAIAAYGEAIAELAKLQQQQEELSTNLGLLGSLRSLPPSRLAF